MDRRQETQDRQETGVEMGRRQWMRWDRRQGMSCVGDERRGVWLPNKRPAAICGLGRGGVWSIPCVT
jgi:hypothetical protein